MSGEVSPVKHGSTTMPGAGDGRIFCAAKSVNFTEVSRKIPAIKFVLAWSKWSHPLTYEDSFGGMDRLYVSLQSQ